MKKLRLLFLSLFFCLIGCSKFQPAAPKKVLRLNFTKNPPTLDPRKGGDPISSTIQFMLFEGLTGMTKESTSKLSLAEKVEIDQDFKTYLFHIKKTKWSNGKPITAYDFEKSWKEMLRHDFPCPNSYLLFPIKNAKKAKNNEIAIEEVGVKAINDQLLEVQLEQPTPYFLELTSFCALFPAPYHLENECHYSFDAPNPNFPVSGAFKIKSWHPGYELVLEKNPYFHAADKVEIDEIRISFVTDEMTAFHLFENNEIDLWGGFFGDIPFEEAQHLKEQNLLQKVSIGSTTFLSLNLEKFPFNNPSIRKAFYYALNRQEIINNILQFDESVAMGCVPPFMKKNIAFDKSDDGNNEKAISYFEQGLKELKIDRHSFPELTLTLGISNLHSRVALAIQDQLQEVLKIKVKLETLDLKVYLDKINTKKHTFALCMSVIQYNDIMNILERFQYKMNPKNFSGFENAQYIKLLQESCLSPKFDLRLNCFLEAEKILLEEVPIVGVYHSNFIYIKQKQIEDFYVSPIGSMHVNYIRIKN